MGNAATFHGYAPDLGYEFLRKAISDNDYKARGCDISADEIFVSVGAKSDSANIQELFSANSRIAVTDPVYPVYVDSNVMAGRTGTYDAQTETWSNVIYMPSIPAARHSARTRYGFAEGSGFLSSTLLPSPLAAGILISGLLFVADQVI